MYNSICGRSLQIPGTKFCSNSNDWPVRPVSLVMFGSSVGYGISCFNASFPIYNFGKPKNFVTKNEEKKDRYFGGKK